MLQPDSSSKPFLGVCFVLFGFDPVSESQVRAKLLSGGGVDAALYCRSCTHVIVDKIVYDDPRCITARSDGKILVTGLWVDHSYDIGMAVDITSILYRPPRDLNGIPGANNLIVCLTGYQRQDREDIMTMVSLMGAKFSKPLVANKVTHLICYRFEGEKYELANKFKTIKLVNHRWLEDCIRDWKLLPEDRYNKSGYEIEMMEAEAKDSEDEDENTTERQLSRKMVNKSPQLKIETPKHSPLPKSIGEVPKVLCNLSEPGNLPCAVNDLLATGREIGDDSAPRFSTYNVSIEPVCLDAVTSTAGMSSGLSNPQEGTPNSRRGDSVSGSGSRCTEKSHSDSRSSAMRNTSKSPRKSPSSILSGDPGNIGGSLKRQLGGPDSITCGKSEYGKDITGSGRSGYLQGSEVLYKEESCSKKQKLDVLYSIRKQQKISRDVGETVPGSPSVCCKVQQDSVSLVDGLSDINKCFTSEANCGIVSPSAAKRSQANTSIPRSSTLEERPSIQDPLFQENLTPKALHEESLKYKTPQPISRDLQKSSFVGKPDSGDFEIEKSKCVTVEATTQLHQQEENHLPSPLNRNKEMEKSQKISNMEELQEENGNLLTKPVRKKTIARRTWGSISALKKAGKQSGPIYSNNAVDQSDPQTSLSKDTAANGKSNSTNESDALPAAVNVTEVMELQTIRSKNSAGNSVSEANFMDDETEPPEDKDVSVDVLIEGNPEVADLLHKADYMMDVEPEGAHKSTKNISAGLNDTFNEEGSILQQKNESTCNRNRRNMKVYKVNQKELGKTRTNTAPNAFKETEFENVLNRQGNGDGKKSKGKAAKEQKPKPNSKARDKTKLGSKKNVESFMEGDKENKPIIDADEITCQAEGHVGNGVASHTASVEIQMESTKIKSKCLKLTEDKKPMKVDPACFILCGHRLQRKDFQQVIKRLKGKFCRDSHQWSYQATHFIAPDPIRRTEKFFAAAASGSWILKTDYLSACSQAGRFLDEQPYEWHGNGLSEDGAINLAAPRKWRLLREKTGHGAFYGMRVIIYGECIAPSLDTLKRVIKAGDGTILATSPPYSRFLASGVDFAVVSPSMPRVDLWVQEFLRHEIPCIVADYLVEYVCKPGYSLERHVLYNTHAWAETSFANLSSKANEIVENSPSDDFGDNDNDVACEVCGSFDREEVMLICGDENGTVGCGIGMHIDCCDPPLECVPEDDWFCPKCSSKRSGSKTNRNCKTSLKNRRNGSSVKNK